MKQINFTERKMIEKMLKQGVGVRAIGRVFCRGHSTISEEISKNKSPHEARYNAKLAQARHERRQLNKGNKGKLARKEKLKKYVIEKIEDDWSPEQVAGELRERCGKTIISHETIYQFIYSEEGKELRLWLHLRRKHRPQRKIRGQRKTRKGEIIKERVSIHYRPEEANERTRLGDLETDSMIFSGRSILSVQFGRRTKLCRLHKCADKIAERSEEALRDSIESLPRNF